jgi:crotonobetainyl-CoA:carnitine CoA-transferase CaiB-like acyl-CoA transferase
VAKALERIKVLDFTHAWAGPYCTELLASFGAEVIKIEKIQGGDINRTLSPSTKAGESIHFIAMNRGKKSVTLNLKSEKGHDICMELVRRVDVIVENFAPQVMNELGLSYDEMKKINPGLIYASVSGFGHSGPRMLETSYDTVAQASGGLVSVTGFPEGIPCKSGIGIGDLGSGIHAASAILAALVYRSDTGEGQMIDISMQDCIWSLVGAHLGIIYLLTDTVPPRLGNDSAVQAPFSIYPAKDGYVVICIATNVQWQRFVRAIGRGDLTGVEKYATSGERVKHREEINALVTQWTRTRTVSEIVNKLKNDNRLACSPVPSVDQVANDPQLISREMVVEVEQPLSGKVKMPGSAFKLSKTPGDGTSPAPFLGQHNYEVYSGILGYSEQEIKKLKNDGVI